MQSLPSHPHAAQPWWLRVVLSRPRLWTATLVAVLVFVLMPTALESHTTTKLITAWNVGAVLYLVLALHMMLGSNHERMRIRAVQHDEGRFFILVLVVLAAVVCIGAIFAELATVKDMQGPSALRYGHIALAALTIASSWLFTQVMFALHYAHDYYVALMRTGSGGLEFPGGHAPDYSDFLYFACVIGTSGQTADVSFTSRAMRRIGTVHCVLAFFFNTTVVALTINIASGLF